jgi:hypothetical protein
MTKFFSTGNENNYFTDHTNLNGKTGANTLNEITNDNLIANTMSPLGNMNTNMTTNFMNNNLGNLAKLLNLSEIEDYVNVKKLEKGVRSIFVPHSPGVYVCINLNVNTMPVNNDTTVNFDSNYEVNKYYKCNAILNIDGLDGELKELLM